MLLNTELRKFNKVKSSLRKKYRDGGFVLIKGNEVFGVWRDRMDTIKKGLEEFGNVPFLVKNIFDDNGEATFSKNIHLL